MMQNAIPTIENLNAETRRLCRVMESRLADPERSIARVVPIARGVKVAARAIRNASPNVRGADRCVIYSIGHAAFFAEHCRDAAGYVGLLPELKNGFELLDAMCAPANAIPRTTENQRISTPIFSLGDYCYRAGNGNPVRVTDNEDRVLQAFLLRPALRAPDLAQLSEVGPDAPRVLKRLTKRYGGIFATAISLPGKKGTAAGYRVNIKTEM